MRCAICNRPFNTPGSGYIAVKPPDSVNTFFICYDCSNEHIDTDKPPEFDGHRWVYILKSGTEFYVDRQ
jgi:hypothetical protein